MTITSLLVPVDYGPDADRALRVAGRVAEHGGLPVELITIGDPLMERDDDRGELLLRAEQLGAVAWSVTVIAADDVSEALARAFADRPDSLPVIGTAAHGAVAEAIDPGVWEQALAATGRTALLVGPHVEETGFAPDRVTIAVTEPDDDTTVVAAACDWADRFGADVGVVDVLRTRGLAEGVAQHALRQVSSALLRHGHPVRVRVVRTEHAGRIVRDLAERCPAIVAVRARPAGPAHGRDGSLRDLLRVARVPVLAVPPAAVVSTAA